MPCSFLVSPLPINEVKQSLACEVTEEIFVRHFKPLGQRRIFTVRSMRRNENVGELPSLLWRRTSEFPVVNVEGCTGDPPFAQCSNQYWLVNQLSTGNIDEIGRRFHASQFRCTDQLVGLRRPLRTQGDKITLGQQGGEGRGRQ